MVAYDLLRVFRLMIRHGALLMGIEDFFLLDLRGACDL